MKGYSVYKRGGRPVWYLSWLSAEDEEWHHVATGFRVDDPLGKAKAKKVGQAKADAYQAAHLGEHRAAWGAWVPQFIRDRHRNSVATRERYLDAWDKLREFLLERRVSVPGVVEYRHAPEYVAWRCAQTKNSGAAINRNTAVYELKVWVTLMHEAVRRGFALGNPIANSGEKKDPAKETPALSAADIAQWRAGLALEEGHRNLRKQWRTTAFEIALHQGCRLHETSVPLSQIDFEAWTIRMRVKGAAGQERWHIAPVHPALRPRLLELRRLHAWKTCLVPKMAGKLLWQFRRKHGLGHTKFHSTRVTVVTELARAGVPEQQAMAYVKHSSRAVHRIYQRLKPADLGACLEALQFPGSEGAQSSRGEPERSRGSTMGTSPARETGTPSDEIHGHGGESGPVARR